MALRGKQPEEIQKRLKAFFYGEWKVGKTTCALQFPKPYLIDTEDGATHKKYAKLLKEAGGAHFATTDYDDLLTEIKELATAKHPYRTLIIDPLTTVYNDLLDKSAENLISDKDQSGTAFSRHKPLPDRKMKRLFNWLVRLDMNVIITSHAKTKWEKDGEQLIDAGLTFDCFKGAPYFFDIIIEIQKRGKKRFGIVKGNRLDGFEEDEQFEFTYDEFAKRCGREVLERESEIQKLATPEQVTEVKYLIDLLKTPEEMWKKWLDKAKSDNWGEMPSDQIQKCIDFLNSKLPQKTAA